MRTLICGSLAYDTIMVFKEIAAGLTHYWRLRCRLPERNGQACRVLARGAMNSILIEFGDGVRHVVSRYAVRRSHIMKEQEA